MKLLWKDDLGGAGNGFWLHYTHTEACFIIFKQNSNVEKNKNIK